VLEKNIGRKPLVRRITEDDEASLISSLASGFLPIFFSSTSVSISVMGFMLPTIIMLAFLLLTIEKPGRLHLFLLLLCISSLISASVVLFVLAMAIHLVFLWVEGHKPKRTQAELTVFSLLLVIWFFALQYKDALILHGPSIVWQNIPAEVLGQYFSNLTLSMILTSTGAIPLVCGVLVMFTYTFIRKEGDVFLLISMVLIITLLLLFKWIELTLGLAYLGTGLIVLSSLFYARGFSYLTKTKFAVYRYPIVALVLVLLAGTSVYPAMSQAHSVASRTTDNDHVRALVMLSNISEQDAIIVATVLEGNSINYFARRKNIADTSFIGIPDAEERLDDIRTVFTSAIETKPAEIMARYGADYIYFTDITKSYYNITKIAYGDGECFPLFYSGREVSVYKRRC
jgi:hypothetical protein